MLMPTNTHFTAIKASTSKDTVFNFSVNLFDGVFFGLALGLASFVSVIPLFVSHFTGSALLIGLIPSIHTLGWQLPQIFMAKYLGTTSLYKPVLLKTTFQERLPFLGLAILALLAPYITPAVILVIIFIMLIWQGFAGGFAANPWQSMVSKVIPGKVRGTFFGAQAGLANLLLAVGAVAAGYILVEKQGTVSYFVPFFAAFIAMMVSMLFLALTRENPHLPVMRKSTITTTSLVGNILRSDRQFLLFVIARNLLQFAGLGINFYAVYLIQSYGTSAATIGLMAGLYAAVQIIANPILGFAGDHFGHKFALLIGAVSGTASTMIVLCAPSPSWLYLSFALAGLTSVAAWTISIAMTLEYGSVENRPAYIGLSNTLTSPSTLIAPVLGGLIADFLGFSAAFVFITFMGIIAVLFISRLKDPATTKKSSMIINLDRGSP